MVKSRSPKVNIVKLLKKQEEFQINLLQEKDIDINAKKYYRCTLLYKPKNGQINSTKEE